MPLFIPLLDSRYAPSRQRRAGDRCIAEVNRALAMSRSGGAATVKRIALALAVSAAAFVVQGCAESPAVPPRMAGLAAALRCAPQTLSRAYFGFDTPGGPVSEAAWQAFVDGEIAPRLPAGFTVLTARGQWRGDDGASRQEESRVLEVVGEDELAQRHVLAEIADRYASRFHQQAVLVTQSPTNACLVLGGGVRAAAVPSASAPATSRSDPPSALGSAAKPARASRRKRGAAVPA